MKLVVIGGVAAGTSAAAKAKREHPDLEVIVLEKTAHASFGACGLPYVIAGDVPAFDDLVARTPEDFARQGIEVRTRHEVVAVDYESRSLQVRDHAENHTYALTFDRLVIATGASPKRLPVRGDALENVFTLRSIEDGEAIARAVAGGARQAVVVGGGYIGLEMAEAFARRGLKVALVEQMTRLLGNIDADIAALALHELERHGIEVLTGATVTGLGGDGRVNRVVTNRGEVGADLALLALGVRPNSRLAASFGVDLTPLGAIAVNERLETNLPGVYAAGDCVEVHHLVTGRHAYQPLGDTANKQGRVVGENVAGGDARFPGVVGSAVFKVFDLGVATTGVSEFEAAALGIDAAAVTIVTDDRASYYPGHRPITVKLVFAPRDGRLLGAEIAGRPDAVKRIDVIAALLHRRGTIDDLAELDLAYAPPFSPAWDPVLVAANRALGARRARFTRVPVRGR